MAKSFLNNLWKDKNFLSVFLSLIIFFVIFVVYQMQLWLIIDKNIQKWLFNYWWNVDDRIVLITIDENTVKKEWIWRFPFDRKHYWKLIENLNRAWASVIWIDIIFAEWDLWNNWDVIFAKSIIDAQNVVLWWWTLDKWWVAWEFEKPYTNFLKWAVSVWSFNVWQDPLTNIVFSVTPFKKFVNWYYEYFWISVLRAYYAMIYNDTKYLTEKSNIVDNRIIIGEKIKIPLSMSLSNKNDVLINFTKRSFNRISFLEIYDDKQFETKQRELWEKFLKDKIVIVWVTLRWQDIIKTPVTSTIWVNNEALDIENDYWVYVHLNFLNTVLTNNFSKYFDKTYELLLIFLLTLLSIFINLNKWWLKLILTNISFLWILFIYFLVVNNYKLVLNFPFELFLSFILALLLSNIVKYLIENEDKTKLNKALSEYVSKDIAAEILSWAWAINLDWEEKRITIFFSDIEWFTTISENFTPKNLIAFLKDYLNEMSNIIIDKRWWVSKYEWDAIMALWGVFNKSIENISYDACDSALNQRQRLIELNTIWQEKWLPKINVRIWIHMGEAIMWNIWSIWKKMEFTAIWDNVNLASRLETINKHYWTYLCVSEAIFTETKDFFEYRYLDKIKVKWKNNAVRIYELLDYKWKLSKIEMDIYEKFQKWIDLYLNKRFDEAAKIFEELSSLWDKPSRVYKDRCDDFVKAPIEDWDWTWVMNEK